MTQLHVTVWPTEGAMSLVESKDILESCNLFREGYHANHRQPPCPTGMKGIQALCDRKLLCAHRLAWNLSVAVNCSSAGQGREIQVRFQWDSRTGWTDKG